MFEYFPENYLLLGYIFLKIERSARCDPEGPQFYYHLPHPNPFPPGERKALLTQSR
jgi:hypothetical protein